MQGINILIVSQSIDLAQEMSSIIDTDEYNFYIATDIAEAINLYETCPPKVILFAHETIDISQSIYFQILKTTNKVDNQKHEAILLCNHENIKYAYEKCKQNIFYDYVIINPKFDRIHVNLTIDKALASFSDDSNNLQVRELSKAANNIKQLNTDVSSVVNNAPKMKVLTAQSLEDLSKKMRTDVNALSERIKKRASEKVSCEELSNAIDEEVNSFSKAAEEVIDVSQMQIDKIVNRWGTELQQVQKKHAPSLEKLTKLSDSTKKMVLIVEDNEVYGDMISKMITSTGKLDAQLKGSVHHGLTSMVCDRPDLVLLDYELPDANATDFLNKVSQIDAIKTIPVVMLTSHTSKDIVNTVLTQGAVDFIVKPSSKKLIIEKLRKWIK